MRKKLLALSLLMILVMSFLGCSASESKEDENSATKPVGKPTITEQVLLEKEGIKVTAVEYVEDIVWGDGIKLTIENNSDKNITLGCDALIINDYMVTDIFAAEVAAGKKSNENLYLSSTELDEAGIEIIGLVEVYFRAYETESWDDIFEKEYAKIETSLKDSMDTTPKDEGEELVNRDGVKIVGKSVDEDSFWGKSILVYLENNTGNTIEIQIEDMSVNGYMMEPIFSKTVYNGKKAITTIDLFSSELEENGITSIENVELKFKVLDETFDEIFTTDTISIKAE